MHMQNVYSNGTVAACNILQPDMHIEDANCIGALPPSKMDTPSRRCIFSRATLLSCAALFSATKQQLRPSRGPTALGASRRSRCRRQVKSPERSTKESPPPSTSASSPSGPLPSSSAQQQLLRPAPLPSMRSSSSVQLYSDASACHRLSLPLQQGV
jgi:hypothetical protein